MNSLIDRAIIRHLLRDGKPTHAEGIMYWIILSSELKILLRDSVIMTSLGISVCSLEKMAAVFAAVVVVLSA